MNDVQSPEEKGKQILEQQAQEQKRIQQEADEQEREEREKLRRLKERRILAYLTYLKIIMEDEKVWQENDDLLSSLQKKFFQQHIQQAHLHNKTMLTNLAHHNAAVSNFLFAGESKEEQEKRDGLLQKNNMDQSEYAALTMADLCKNPKNNEDAEKVFSGRQPSEKFQAQRRESCYRVNTALTEFSEGNIEKMETILKDGLATACHAFSHTKDTLNAIHWSKQINGILSVVNSHPVLFKGGANTPLLEAATGMAALGRVMENGLEALNELHSARLNGTQLPPEKEVNLQSQILLMQQTDVQRSNEQYQKFFAKGYHPKTGLHQEKMKNLLVQLNTSEAIYTLSTMSKDEKLFALSDVDSRRFLSESLFVPHIEKNKTAPEKQAAAPNKSAAPEKQAAAPEKKTTKDGPAMHR